MSKLSDDDIQKIQEAIRGVTPPSIGLIGVSGVGKSSTINAMFKTSLAISHTVACTKEFKTTEMTLKMTSGDMSGNKINLQVIDAPGLGEDIFLDPTYIGMYHKHLPKCDVILWVLSARNRAMALDQKYLDEFKEFHKKIVFGVNQIDLVHPMNWNHKINLPSVEMENNLKEISDDRAKKLSSVTKTDVKVVPYSATYGFNLEKLFKVLIQTISEDRRWIFGGLKNFSYQDFFPTEFK
jgi:hypothetical protein